jgi:triacylglycerol esterase/lipase EstA (alpha/beta hydrolase family)
MRAKKIPVVDTKKTVEVDGVSNIDYSRWTVKDVIQNYVKSISKKTKVQLVNGELYEVEVSP